MEGKRNSAERELISPNGDKRLVRRDHRGRFTKSDDHEALQRMNLDRPRGLREMLDARLVSLALSKTG